MSNKLIRLHSEDRTGNFNCFFQDGIVINPDSEIALQSCTIDRSLKFLNINALNNIVEFQVQGTTGIKRIAANLNMYTRETLTTFFQDIQDKMNNKLNVNVAKEAGTQINIDITPNEKTRFSFSFSKKAILNNTGAFIDQHTTYTGIDLTNSNIKSDSAASTTDITQHTVIHNKSFIRGAGYFRVRLNTFNDPAQGGFIMGFISEDAVDEFHNGNFTENDIEYGIKCPKTNELIKIKYPGLVGADPDGFVDTTVNLVKFLDGDPDSNNDQLQIEISLGKIELVHYNERDNVRNLLLSQVFDRSKYYYPFISMLSGTNHCKLKSVHTVDDPYHPSLPNHVDIEHTEETALTAPSQNSRATVYKLKFADSEVADYIGFDDLEQNPNDIPTPEGEYIADRKITNVISSDSFVLEMLNMPLESYDSQFEGQKNILAVIPTRSMHLNQTSSVIDYEPNEKFFISLKNNNPLRLRNINARIVNEDFDEINTEGQSTLNLVVRDKCACK